MLNNKKRNLIGLGAIVGTVGLVSAIAIPLALRTTADTNSETVLFDGSESGAKAELKQASADTATAILTKAGVSDASLKVSGVTQAGNKVIITGTTGAARKRTAVAVKLDFTITITMNDAASTIELMTVTPTGVVKKEAVEPTKVIADLVIDLGTKFMEAVKPAAPSVDAGTGTGSGDNTGTGTGSGDNTGSTGGTTTTALALSEPQLQAMVDASTGAVKTASATAANVVITKTTDLPAAGSTGDVTYSVAAMSGYTLGSTPPTFTVSVTIAATAIPTTEPTVPQVLASKTAEQFKALVHAELSKAAVLVVDHTAAPAADALKTTTLTIDVTKPADAAAHTSAKTVAVTVTLAAGTVDTTKGTMVISYTTDNGNVFHDSITMGGWHTTDPVQIALKAIPVPSSASLVAAITDKTTKLASKITASDIVLPTVHGTAPTAETWSATVSGDDSTQTVTVTFKATIGTAADAPHKVFPALTITGFAKVASAPTSITLVAGADGIAISSGLPTTTGMTFSAATITTEGAASTDVTITPAAGYLWADGTKVEKHVTAKVTQTAWSTALSTAKTDAIQAITNAAGGGTKGLALVGTATAAINAEKTLAGVASVKTTQMTAAADAKAFDDAKTTFDSVTATAHVTVSLVDGKTMADVTSNDAYTVTTNIASGITVAIKGAAANGADGANVTVTVTSSTNGIDPKEVVVAVTGIPAAPVNGAITLKDSAAIDGVDISGDAGTYTLALTTGMTTDTKVAMETAIKKAFGAVGTLTISWNPDYDGTAAGDYIATLTDVGTGTKPAEDTATLTITVTAASTTDGDGAPASGDGTKSSTDVKVTDASTASLSAVELIYA